MHSKDILEELLLKPKYPDVEFLFPEENKTIKAQKSFLSLNNEVCDIMFNSNIIKSQKYSTITKIIIEDIKSEAFINFLRFCYLRDIDIEPKQYISVLYVAAKYQHKELIKLITGYITSNTDYGYLLKTLGELMEMDIKLSTFEEIKEHITILLSNKPLEFLQLENTFNTLSPSIKEHIFNLFEWQPDSYSNLKLERMIEYGLKLQSSQNEIISMKVILEPCLKQLNVGKLDSRSLNKLKEYEIFSQDELLKIAFQKINEYETLNTLKFSEDLVKYDLNKVQFKGNINFHSNRSFLIISKGGLHIRLQEPQIIKYIQFKLYSIFPPEISIKINYSDSGSHWKFDSAHYVNYVYTNYETYKRCQEQIYLINEQEKHKFWKIIIKIDSTRFQGTQGDWLSIMIVK